jgi:hypothetical protein
MANEEYFNALYICTYLGFPEFMGLLEVSTNIIMKTPYLTSESSPNNKIVKNLNIF